MTKEITPSAPHISKYIPEANQVFEDLGLVVEGQAISPNWTDAKIKRVSLSIFAAVCVIGGAALIGLSVTGIIPPSYGYLAIPLFLLAITSVCLASQILDYEDPLELQKMKEEAPHLTYRQLVSKHGLANVLKHDILPLDQLEDKFSTYIAGMTFRVFNKEFSREDLELLELYSILGQEDLVFLKGLKIRLEDGVSNLRQVYQVIDRKYPNRLNLELHSLKCAEAIARIKCEIQIQKVVDQWDKTIEKDVKEISSDSRDYQNIVNSIRTAREEQKARAVANATTREQNILRGTLQSLQSRIDFLSTDPTALDQQANYDREIETARSEHNGALQYIEAEFSKWLNSREET